MSGELAKTLRYGVEMTLDPFGNAMTAPCPSGRSDAKIRKSMDLTEQPGIEFNEIVLRADRAGLIRIAHELLAMAHVAIGAENADEEHVHLAIWNRHRNEEHAQLTVRLVRTNDLPPWLAGEIDV